MKSEEFSDYFCNIMKTSIKNAWDSSIKDSDTNGDGFLSTNEVFGNNDKINKFTEAFKDDPEAKEQFLEYFTDDGKQTELGKYLN